MKIAVLIKRFVTTGGAEKYAYELTRRIARVHEVHVFSYHWEFNGKERIIFHKIPNKFKKPNWLNQWQYAYYCRKAILEQEFDIVHSHEKVFAFDLMTIHSPCFKTYITNKKGVAKGLSVLATLFSLRKIAWLLLEWIQFCWYENKLFMAVSQNVMENVIKCYGIPKNRFTVVYPGVEGPEIQITTEERAELRRKLGFEEDDKVFLFVGNEFKRKGLDTLIKAFRMLDLPKGKLVVVGDGGGRFEHYKRLTAQLVEQKRIFFVGHVREVTPYYQIADVFVMPTLSDPFGMAPIEASRFGLPVIVSNANYCGAAECVNGSKEFILTDPTDELELLEKLNKVTDALKDKGEKNLLTSFSYQSWDEAAMKTLELYERIVKMKGQDSRYSDF